MSTPVEFTKLKSEAIGQRMAYERRIEKMRATLRELAAGAPSPARVALHALREDDEQNQT